MSPVALEYNQPIGRGSSRGVGPRLLSSTFLSSASIQAAWYESSTYDVLFAGADINNDRYFLPGIGSEMLVNGDLAIVPATGSNLVNNPDFATGDLTGWTAYSGTTFAITSGELIVTSTGSGYSGVLYTLTGLTIGARYRVKATGRKLTAPNGQVIMNVARTLAGTDINQWGNTSLGTTGASTSHNYFTATATTHTVTWFMNGAFANGEQFGLDNVEIVEITNSTAVKWETNAPLTFSGGKATWSASGTSLLQTVTLEVGKLYVATFTVSDFASGLVRADVGNVSGTNRGANGTYTEYYRPASSLTNFGIAISSTFTGSVDNISLKEVITTPVGRTYGPELLVNGGFDTGTTLGAQKLSNSGFSDTSAWTAHASVALNSPAGKATWTATPAGSGISQAATLDTGVQHLVMIYRDSRSAGSLRVRVSGDTTWTSPTFNAGGTGAGVWAFWFIPAGPSNTIHVEAVADYSGVLDIVGVQPQSNPVAQPWLLTASEAVYGWPSGGSGVMNLIGDGTLEAKADQSITTVIGQVYEVRFDTDANGVDLRVGTTRGGTQLGIGYRQSAAGAATSTVKFTATSTTTWIGTANYSGATGVASLVSVKAITAMGVYPKRSATWAEWFAFTAGGTQAARSYTGINGLLKFDMVADTPRFDYTNSIGSNIQVRSQEFDVDAAWGKNTTTIGANAAVAPDGTTTADLVTEIGGAGSTVTVTSVNGSGGTAASAPHTGSIFVKKGNHDWVYFELSDHSAHAFYAYFNVNTGVMGTSGSVGSATFVGGRIQSYGDGWYRLIISGTAGGSAAMKMGIKSATADGNGLTAPGRTRYLWGAQHEHATSVSAYVPTTTTAVYGAMSPLAKRQYRHDGAGTNLLLHSQNFTNPTNWVTAAAALTANDATAPDGTLTAGKVTESASTAEHYINQAGTISFTSGTTYTISTFAKAGTSNKIGLFLASTTFDSSNRFAWFNLTGAGSVGAVGTGFTATITALANGWYRVTLTGTATSTAVGTPGILLHDGSGSLLPSYAGNTANTVYVWGAQVEASPFASAYIPTAGSTVTRAADDPRFSPEIEAILARSTQTVVVRLNADVIGATSPERPIIGPNAGGRLMNSISSTGIAQYNPAQGGGNATLGSGTTDEPMGAAYALSPAGLALCANGGAVGRSPTITPIARTAPVRLGRNNTSTDFLPGGYDFIGISPEELPDANLQSLAVAA